MVRLLGLTSAVALLLALTPGAPRARPLLALNEPHVCVICPLVQANRNGVAIAEVPLARPTVFVAEPLAEIRIERDGTLLWREVSRPEAPLQGPLRWPLAPLRPGETVLLRLRPEGAEASHVASLQLTAASADRMATAERLLANLGRDPTAWRQAIEQLLERQDLALAWLLIFAFEGPSEPQLDALRLELFRRGCQPEPGLTSHVGPAALPA
ncbi:MAG: hypothetical protein VKO00_11220 [Cyanobacteriota bacterium]|nr:hypothetical protein [Cyanobacteriota bacterium]